MSIVAWDGKCIAADKQATSAGLRTKTTKLRKLPSGEALAWTGDQAAGEMLAKWYEDGADLAKWPSFQADKDNWCRLIVARSGGAKFFEMQPIAIAVENEFMAWGSGRDFAMGAMRRGATAPEAVEIAAEFADSCGLGVDVVRFE